MKKYRIVNNYHGNTQYFDFETFEEAKKEADKIDKKRKNAIFVYEYIREGNHLLQGKNTQIYKEVYATKNRRINTWDVVFNR